MKRRKDYLDEIINIDINREIRAGKPEAIYAESKSPQDLVAIVNAYLSEGKPVLVTKLNKDQISTLKREFSEIEVNERGRIAIVGNLEREIIGKTAILTAGTSDVPIAEEAATTAKFLGLEVMKFYDVGIAGLHRVLKPIKKIKESETDSIIVVAGMEGALPSVVAGLVDLPVIAVPTSVGYGVHLRGISTLFAMLQSCPSGVAVVNIDNGFGAAVLAYLISRVKFKALSKLSHHLQEEK